MIDEPTIKIANGASERSNNVKNVTLPWSGVLKRLRSFPVSPGERSYMLAGHVPGGVRGAKHGAPIEHTSLLMLDLDGDSGLTFDELVDAMEFCVPYACAVYTTRSYDGHNVRFRVIVPFAAPLSAGAHSAAVVAIVGLLPGSVSQHLDRCSYRAEQPIFLPCVAVEGAPHHFCEVDGTWFDPVSMGIEPTEVGGEGEGDTWGADDLDVMITSQPLDLDDEEITAYLSALDPNTLSYGLDEGVFGWGNVGAALHHQYSGSEAGYARWAAWSSRNEEKHNERGMATKWRSFSVIPRGRKPITFASVIHAVKERASDAEGGSGASASKLDELLAEAREVESLDGYKTFVNRISKMPEITLGVTERSLIAKELAGSDAISGKGVPLANIRKDLAASKRGKLVAETSIPEWLQGWCYLQVPNLFFNVKTNLAIGRDAFNATFTREQECLSAGMNSAEFALHFAKISCYANLLYWPKAGTVVRYGGVEHVNSYSEKGTPVPRAPVSESDFNAIKLLDSHFELLIGKGREREREILKSWLAHVYRHPDKKPTWAIFLQGGQGIGKTFIDVAMRKIMGKNAITADAGLIGHKFNSAFANTVLVTVEEVRVTGENRYMIMDSLKPVISNDEIQIEEKGRERRNVKNWVALLLLSNHKDALPVEQGDRRYCVLYSDLQTHVDLTKALSALGEGGDYFDRLFSLLEPATIGLVAWYFAHHIHIDSAFRHNGRAPITDSFLEACAMSDRDDEGALEEAVAEHHCGAINERVVCVHALKAAMEYAGQPFPKTKALNRGLIRLGYSKVVEKVWVPRLKRRVGVWYRKENVRLEKDAIKELLQHYSGDYDDVPF